jgi:threonine dehydratase
MTSNPSGSTAVSTVTVRDIWKAKKRISSVIQKTPFIPSPVLSKLTGASVYLKLENMHEIGAFKVRGAANKILSLSPDELRRGVTTFSTGNHGLAVAYMAKKLGIKAVICISERVPKAKVEAIRLMGCQLEIWGTSQDEASQRCYRLQEEQGMIVIHPFDDPYVIAGQGTIGLEIAEELPEVELTIAGLSGGGLLSGVGLALKSVDPNISNRSIHGKRGGYARESQSGKAGGFR